MMEDKKEYIDRDGLRKRIETLICADCNSYNGVMSRACLFDDVRNYVEDYPAADVAAVVHGKWCWEGKFKACSECGSYVEWNETLGANFWKYCPYCGAKMDGGKE